MADNDPVQEMHSALGALREAVEDGKKDMATKAYVDPLVKTVQERTEQAILRMDEAQQKSDRLQKAAEDRIKALEQETLILKRSPGGLHKGAPPVDDENLYCNDYMRARANAAKSAMSLSERQQKALQRANEEGLAEYKTNFNAANLDGGGVFLPLPLIGRVVNKIIELSPVAALIDFAPIDGEQMDFPIDDVDMSAAFVEEMEDYTTEQAPNYGLRTIVARDAVIKVPVTQKMLDSPNFDLTARVVDKAAIGFAKLLGTKFVNGTAKMEGILVNSSITTFNSGNATAITFDALRDMPTRLKTGVATDNMRYLFNRVTTRTIYTAKDGQGQYLWTPGNSNAGIPNLLNGFPYTIVPDMPDQGAGNKPVAFGDWRRCYQGVRRRLGIGMLRDPYTNATKRVVVFYFYDSFGGGVIDPQYAVTMTCSA